MLSGLTKSADHPSTPLGVSDTEAILGMLNHSIRSSSGLLLRALS